MLKYCTHYCVLVSLLFISTAETFQPFSLLPPAHSLPHSLSFSPPPPLSQTPSISRNLACRRQWSTRKLACESAAETNMVSERGADSIYFIQERPPHSATKLIAEKNSANLLTYLEKKGIAEHNQEAFDLAMRRYEQHCEQIGRKVPIVLDSCCGTGRSTQIIAQHRPGAFVIGMDKSAPRLARTKAFREREQDSISNMVLVRANCIDMWELLWRSDLKIQEHFLLYPNPYPKPTQLSLRWHGSPAFALLLLLGGRLEVRASWCTYLLEFAAAAQHLLDHWHSLEPELDQAQPASSSARGPGGPALSMSDFTEPRPLAPPPILDTSSDSNLRLGEAEGEAVTLTNFEGKYLAAKLRLYRLQATSVLPRRGPGSELGAAR